MSAALAAPGLQKDLCRTISTAPSPGANQPQMMSILRSLSVLSMLLLPALAQEDTRTKYLLRSNLRAGLVTKQRMTQTTIVRATRGGEESVATSTMKTFTTSKVRSVDGADAVCESTITRIKSRLDKRGEQIEYDSDTAGDGPHAQFALAGAIGKTATMVVSDRGAVKQVELPESLREANGVNFEAIFAQVGQQMPEHPVAIGDTWTVPQGIPAGPFGEIQVEMSYTLVAVNEESYVLDHAVKMKSSTVDLPMKIKLASCEAKGVVIIDRVLGSITSTSLKTDMTFEGPIKMRITMHHDLLVDLNGKDIEPDDSQPVTNDRSDEGSSTRRVDALR